MHARNRTMIGVAEAQALPCGTRTWCVGTVHTASGVSGPCTGISSCGGDRAHGYWCVGTVHTTSVIARWDVRADCRSAAFPAARFSLARGS